MMRLEIETLRLQLENPFKLSYGATTVRENVVVRLHHDALTGVGEAAVVPYYGETPSRVIDTLSDSAVLGALHGDPLLLEDTLDALPVMPSRAAQAALDMALHDVWGQRLGQPLYRLWGLNPEGCPISSFTVAMADDEADYRVRLRAARDFSVIKLKLGSGDPQADMHMVKVAREETDADLCVDANGAWDADTALRLIPQLGAAGVIFVEQPVAMDDWEGWRQLRAELPPQRPALIADESSQGMANLPQLAGLVDGINIKLAKCGGLRPARQLITVAKTLGLKILLGCMVESSVAVTAAAHLAPLADFADLDGNLLIQNDPYQGVQNTHGRLRLPDGPGLGVAPRAAAP